MTLQDRAEPVDAGDVRRRRPPPLDPAEVTKIQLLADDCAYLTDLHRGTAGLDWKQLRKHRVHRALTLVVTFDPRRPPPNRPSGRIFGADVINRGRRLPYT